MARLNKKERAQLLRALQMMEAVKTAVRAERTVIAVKSHGTTTLEYQNPNTGDYITPVNKGAHEITAFADNAARSLQAFLETN